MFETGWTLMVLVIEGIAIQKVRILRDLELFRLYTMSWHCPSFQTGNNKLNQIHSFSAGYSGPGHQPKQRSSDFPLPNHLLQLFWVIPRHSQTSQISLVCPLLSWACLKRLTKETSRRHPSQMNYFSWFLSLWRSSGSSLSSSHNEFLKATKTRQLVNWSLTLSGHLSSPRLQLLANNFCNSNFSPCCLKSNVTWKQHKTLNRQE